MTCHACGAAASDKRAYGWLCVACWERVSAIVERIIGRKPTP